MKDFKVNDQGGWIIPANTKVTDPNIPAYSSVGSNVTFGNFTKFGSNTTFGSNTKFGYNIKFGHTTTFSQYTTFGHTTKFGNFTKFSDHTTFDTCTIFGNFTTFSDHTTFGNFTRFGERTTYRDIPDCYIAILSNIDGTMRQLVCVFSENTCMIEAGCFWGTLEEFSSQARREGKLLYASAVPAFCTAISKTLKEKEAEK